MPGLFTFIKPPIVSLLEAVPQFMPGIEKVVCLYFNDISHRVECKSIHKPFMANEIIDYKLPDHDLTSKLRAQKPSINWVNAGNLEFETIKPMVHQLNIFDEQQVMVLCMGFENQSDGRTDLLYVYLSTQNSNVGIAHQEFLPTSEKHTIGVLVYNGLSTLLRQNLQNRTTLQQVNHQYIHLTNENAKLKFELDNVKRESSKGNLEIANEELSAFNYKYNCHITFSDDAIEKISHFKGRQDNLISTVKNAFSMALNLSFGLEHQKTILQAHLILFEESEKTMRHVKEPILQNQRDQKTIQLLDKLEQAANIVAMRHQKLTGENVGQACEQSISAPAITDALKNHQKKVVKLMAEHPEKWNTIRHEFRPILNILSESKIG